MDLGPRPLATSTLKMTGIFFHILRYTIVDRIMLNIYIYSRSDHQSNRCVLRLEIATVSAVVKYKQQNKEAKLFPTSNVAQFDPFIK